MSSASSAERSTNVPFAPKPSIGGTWLLEPVARISRWYFRTSPVPSTTWRPARSIRVACVFSHVVMLRSSYQESGFR
jgi:hypothetical protein